MPEYVEGGGELGGEMEFDYTFSMEKIRKQVTAPDPNISGERFYLGGAEFKDYKAVFYNFGDGRVLFASEAEEIEEDRFQYHIADHLGNNVVTFEDRDGDGNITTESDTDNEEDWEVVQRNLYYPFGLAQQGCWRAETTPEMNYLYNGKELENDLGFDMAFYGFRLYDAAIGRFGGVDPISDRFAFVSVFNYAENSPIAHIDLHGLQALFAPNGRLIAYKVQQGQGPTQIAADLNVNHSSSLSNLPEGQIKWQSIVLDNLPNFTNVVNGDGSFADKDNSDYTSGNIKTGEILAISDGNQSEINSAKKQLSMVEEKLDSINKDISKAEDIISTSEEVIRIDNNPSARNDRRGNGNAGGSIGTNILNEWVRKPAVEESKEKRKNFVRTKDSLNNVIGNEE